MEYKHAIACARRGDVDFFKTVALDILLNARNDYDLTVLHVAAWEGHLDCCEVIVERCTPLLYDQDNYNKWSALHQVANSSKNLENIMRFLLFTADSKPDLELGGGPKLPNKRLLKMKDRDGYTALHIAVKLENHWATKLLLEADREFELLRMVDEDGETYLHLAAEKGDHVLAELIVKARPGIEFLKMTGRTSKQTALHIAVEKKSLAIVQLLLEVDHSNDLLAMINSDQQTALHVAAKRGNLEMVKLIWEADPDKQLLSMPDSQGNTPLHFAAGNNNLAVAGLLLEADHSNDLLAMINSDQQTALHIAAEKENLDMVKLIFEVGLDKQLLSMPDSRGNTPLHLAVENSNLEIVRLLSVGDMVVDYDANNSRQTPLLLAISKVAQDGPGSDSEVICNLLLTRNSSQCRQRTGDTGGDMRWTPLHYAVSYGFISVVEEISRLCPNYIWVEDSHGQIPYMIATRRVLSGEHEECLKSDLEIIRILLEKDSKQCTKLEDKHDQPFIHVAVKLGLNDVVETILKSKEMEATILNIQDKDGNTPLHIAALGENKPMTLCLLYDERVSKGIENNKKEKAIDFINFPYDEAKARVYSLGHQSDLKDQSSFDLLVAALIATVSFTAGLTVPGGYVSDGVNKGSAILLKATTFKVFVVSNNIALLFSLYTVFLNFSTRRLLKKGDIYYESKTGTFRTRLLRKTDDMIYSLNTATLCTLSAIYAMVVAFITGSYAVLANSDGLAITVCVSSSFFLILASHATWTMAMQYWHSKPVPGVSS